MKRFLLTLVLLGFTLPAFAQAADSYVLRSYAVGATSPTSTFSFVSAAVTCNLAPPTSTSTINPTRVVWDDPGVTGRVCVWIDPGTGPLFALPIGTYEATLTAVNSVGASVEQTTRSPFSKQSAPATVTGLHLYR